LNTKFGIKIKDRTVKQVLLGVLVGAGRVSGEDEGEMNMAGVLCIHI
jgi:hypothetical protein